MCCQHATNNSQSTLGCRGGHCQGHCPCHTRQAIELTAPEHAFLMDLAQIPFLPLARFILASTRSDHARSVALAPVYLTEETETLERVRETGAVLLALQEKGLVSLDYDMPLQGCGYAVYRNSSVYRLFTECVAEGSHRPGFLFDQAELELGSIALTSLGRNALDQLIPA